ncbi:YciE/YciF ferroxidase family protein [Flavobacterium hauense]
MLQNIAHQHNDEARELRGLFEKQLKELLWSEQAMPTMLEKCIYDSTSKDLISQLEKQRIGIFNHTSRLEAIFEAMGIAKNALPYPSLECLMQEALNIVMQIRSGVVRDAAIIAVLQKIEHYKIACYGTMRAYAIALREEDIVGLLEQTLEEEKLADLSLSHIAESHINIEAADKEI